MSHHRVAASISAVVLGCLPLAASADAPPLSLDATVDAGFLTSTDAHGAALGAGLRLGIGSCAALGVDLGYGVIVGSMDTQDRWWIMSSAAWVVPVGPVELELGGGLGLAATSGYRDLDHFVRDPFMPTWAYQLVPALRVHVGATTALDRNVDGFVRLEAGSVLLDHNDIGLRDAPGQPSLTDQIWLNLAVGTAFHLF